VIALLVVPLQMALIPIFKLYSHLGLYGNVFGLILFHTAFGLPFAIFLLRNFFIGIPKDILESARIDGASELRIFWTVYRPLAQPMTAAFTVIAFLQNWNNFLFPLVVTSSEHLMMISQGLTEFQGAITGTAYNLLMAGSLIAVIPVLIVAMVAQRKVVEGLTIGAVR
jgi:ABC-type glycerol-3-phosphate transport system permease component